jgi:transposase, IS30 family
MGRRGRKRQLALEDEYWQLIFTGVGTVEACRRIGIGRKTGFRWRKERGGIAPARLLEEERSGRYLTLLERQRIATLRSRGESLRAIAGALGRSPSTISREVRRNLAPHDRGVYDGDLAHARARSRASRQRPGKLQRDAELRRIVAERLALDWSPEQIAAWLRLAHPTRPEWHLCHETIYQGLYAPAVSGLSRTLTKRLRTGRPLRRRRRSPLARTPRFRAPSLLIDERPPDATSRLRVGDWEGDLIVGRQNRSAIGILVDRRSRLVRLVHLPVGHGADEVRNALRAALIELPAAERRTLTWDQGPEMAAHDGIDELLGEGVYFAHPGAPWQRGTCENTNRLLRQYFPKGSDLSQHSAQALQRIEELLNHRPRKLLDWRTPAEVHRDGLGFDIG